MEAAIISQMSMIVYQSPECNATAETSNITLCTSCRNCIFVLALSSFPSNGKGFIRKFCLSLVVSWLISRRVWKAGYCSNLSWQVPVQEFSKSVISVHPRFVNTPEEPAAFMFSLPADGSRGSYRTLVSSSRTKQCYTSVFPFKCAYCPVSLLLKHVVFIFPFCTTLNTSCTWHYWC